MHEFPKTVLISQLPPVAMTHLDALKRYAEQRGALALIGSRSTSGYRIAGPLGEEVWVEASTGTYRSLFQQVHGQLSGGIAVDHAFARKGAMKLGIGWVLVGALPTGPNASHGARFERRVRSSSPPFPNTGTLEASPQQMQKILARHASPDNLAFNPVGWMLTSRERAEWLSYINGPNDFDRWKD